MPIGPAVIEGFSGLDKSADAERFRRAMHSHTAKLPEGASAGPEITRLLALMAFLAYYNTLLPLLAEEWAARERRVGATMLVEDRWDDLRTAERWPAAHHVYVLAVRDARDAIDAWESRAAAVAAVTPSYEDSEEIRAAYKQVQDAGHPPLDIPKVDPAAHAAKLRASLEESHAKRIEITRETLGLIGQAAVG